MKIKKLVTTFILGMGMTFTGVLGYASVSYVLNKTVEENVTVGETAVYTEGIIVELIEYDQHTLTFLELGETDTSKHYLTYTYSYDILVEGMDIEVSSLSTDIEVTGLTYTETTISITFSLNQELEFNEGDIINVQFYFEATQPSLGGFTASNPLDINTATHDDLVLIGLSEIEIQRTLDKLELETFSNANEWAIKIEVAGFLARYSEYEDLGIIVFNE